MLEENVVGNGFSNVRAVHSAASAQAGSILIEADSESLVRKVAQTAKGSEVKTIPLDDLIAQHGLDRVRLVKLNIEGAEVEALEGLAAASTIVGNLAVLCHHFLAERSGDEYYRTKARVKVTMEQMGYQLTEHPDAILPWARDYVYGRESPMSEQAIGLVLKP